MLNEKAERKDETENSLNETYKIEKIAKDFSTRR